MTRHLAGPLGVALLLVLPGSAGAVIRNGAPAIDALGQYDEDPLTDPGPIYTKGPYPNDVPNRLGIYAPRGSVIDTAGHHFFVADYANNRVFVYNLNADNTLPDRVPDAVLGQPNFYGNVGAQSQTGMQWPVGLTYDAANSHLFVVDSSNNRVLVFDVATITNGEPAANVLGQPTFETGSHATTQSGMRGPAGVAFDTTNNRLFVADTDNRRVLVFDLSGGITNGMNASNVLGQPNFTSRVPAPTVTPAGTDYPAGVAFDTANNRLFVADSGHHRILVFDLSGGITNGMNASNVLGQPNFTSRALATTQAGMRTPYDLAFDEANNRLFVIDSGNNRVLVFDVIQITNGEDAVHVLGQPNFTSRARATTQAGMGPAGATFDAANNRLFVADSGHHRVLVFDVIQITNGENAIDALGQTDGDLTNPAPIYTKGNPHDAPNRLGFNDPSWGLALDTTDRRLFVSDSLNNRVLIYNLDTTLLLGDRIPDAVLGQPDFASYVPAAPRSTTLYNPYGLAYDAARKRLFVVDGLNHRVLVFDATTIANGEGASNVLGQGTFSSQDRATSARGMRTPNGVAYDGVRERLFVSDSENNRVLVYDVTEITNGEAAVHVLGQLNFTAASAGTSQTTIRRPEGLAYDATGDRLFVVERGNNRVTVFDTALLADGEPAVAVLGQPDFVSSLGATTASVMGLPAGAAFDAVNNRLFVAENGNNRVLVFQTSQIANGQAALAVLGHSTFTLGFGDTRQRNMRNPTAVAYEPSNELLYVSDTRNHRVTVYDAAAANRAPIAEAGISIDGGTPASIVNVFQGESVTVRLFADQDVTGDKRASRDPDGWTDVDFGVQTGGTCEWNRDLNQGVPTFEPPVIRNPATPTACSNINLGSVTFNDAPGTYTYQVLRITDRPGAASLVASVSVRVQVRPDLGVQLPTGQSLYRSLENPFTGDLLTFSFRVQNIFHAAGTPAGASTARVCLDDPCYFNPAANVISTHPAASLANGGSTVTITSGPWTATAGSHAVTLCADIPGGAGVVPERAEAATSNCSSETFTVAGPADLTVSSITITPSRPLLGDPLNVDAVIENVGGIASLASSARLDVDRDGDGVFETLVSPDQPVPVLAPQETSTVSWPNATTAAVGRMVFRVCVDPANQNPEDCLTQELNRPPFRPGRFREAPP